MTATSATATRRRNRRRALGLALVGPLVLVTPLAAAGDTATSAHGPSTSDQRQVLRFEVKFSPFNIVDVPPRARFDGDYQAGDYVTFSDRLFDGTGRRVGAEAGSGLLTKVSKAGLQVSYTLTIRLAGRGQISAQGLSTSAPTKRLAVTGGTSRYVGAAGSLTLVENGDGTGSLTVTLDSSA
jgi:Allene oxide cyclase barrel like domain